MHNNEKNYQVENEYGNIESSYGQRGKNYVKWAAGMAIELGARVPWVMCQQADAPETIVSYSPLFTTLSLMEILHSNECIGQRNFW